MKKMITVVMFAFIELLLMKPASKRDFRSIRPVCFPVPAALFMRQETDNQNNERIDADLA